ncbi:hypothetical protein OEZ86_006309 [Tetradesmus obliquus]|nr:hypothetical protein OEZ86_006309 [Tetradesmus obliquus]
MAKAVLLVCFGLLVALELLDNAGATPDTQELQQGRHLLIIDRRINKKKEYTALAAAPGAKTGTDKVPAAPQAKMTPTATASMVPKKAAVPAAKAATAPAPVKSGRLLLSHV